MTYAHEIKVAIGAAGLVALTLGAPPLAADAFSTDWAKAAKSDARLVAASRTLAGFEIRLAPGAITYWRDPGDAGVPPTFDFSKSSNVAGVEASFPAPKRIREQDGSEAFGYDSDVVIPLTVEPSDPSKPVTLALEASYAVCEKLCLPARAKLELTLPGAASPDAGRIEAALAAAPRVVAPEAFAMTGDAAGGWRVCVAREEGAPRDLFVEPPSGWWVTAAPDRSDGARDCFAVAVRDKPAGAAPPVALRLTLTGGKAPVETTVVAR
ncbi:DsbC/DsbD-like thiol-disulfide interchange protein [Roseiarcus fermentans]|uniref:DsbC/DsbD-like thiol-disulfide interchange protein n=1 Tax=Roseiarcus fermentans TaxID=1473586 RepID=A0A366FRR8_9HYPH|nr:protein-disulfide reductase DsbD domain-containing protein [Roseiarcus fermentans]RBP17308.1 DsbC/DsbD-like thiol-disulfide interchange protein [Roseiarcus fermentans]